MDSTEHKPLGKMFLSLPLAAVAAGFFFMPWVGVSCDPKGLTNASEFTTGPAKEVFADGPAEMATASGWQLARGDMTLVGQFSDLADAAKQQQKTPNIPAARPWVYACLALPAALLLTGLLGIGGVIAADRTGRWMMLCGVVGIVLTLVAFSVDYVDDVVDAAREQFAKASAHVTMAPGAKAEIRKGIAQGEKQMQAVLLTRATRYLWGTMLLHVVTVGCGLAVWSGAQVHVKRPSGEFRRDTPVAGRSLTQHPAVRSPARDADFGQPLPPLGSPTASRPQPPART